MYLFVFLCTTLSDRTCTVRYLWYSVVPQNPSPNLTDTIIIDAILIDVTPNGVIQY
jgi:hypothetical protein